MYPLRTVSLTVLLAALIAGPAAAQSPAASAGPSPSSVPALAVPRCEDVPEITVPAELFRDSPIYVANEQPAGPLQAWARRKPGFETLWIDRDHLGWVVLAFSIDADARQADLEREFPDVGAVAVGVDWTYRGLRRLQRRVVRELGSSFPLAVGIYVTRGVVSISPGVLYPERVAEIERRFGGERICVEGLDPADVPAPGPQPQSGDGWRLLGHRKVGAPYRTGIATDAASLNKLWRTARMPKDPPAVDFEREVVIWFGAVYGSSCPGIRLDDVVVDPERAIVHALIVLPDPPPMCTDDAIGHAYLVALDRDRLPAPPFAIQLDADGPPPGAPEEVTVVEADLRVLGATAGPGEVHGAPPVEDRFVLRSGMIMEPGFPFPYLLDARCGVEWLGELNDVWWRTGLQPGEPGFVPPEWVPAIDANWSLELSVLLLLGEDPEVPDGDPRIEATLNGLTVTYRPTSQAAPECEAIAP